jgi:hypothetical protein
VIRTTRQRLRRSVGTGRGTSWLPTRNSWRSTRKNYENFKKVILNEQTKIEKARQEARALGQGAAGQSEREKECVQYANGSGRALKFDNSKLAEAKEAVRQKIDANRAAGDVARDMGRAAAAEAADDELERQAAAADVLARYKKN